MSDFTPDVINITKIKEGFHTGDELAATNLDVILQLKVTHMINAAGSQIINAWETIGIKYLTLNWSENPSQNLFDSKDEIANRIVFFIDDSFNKGEGLLVHSMKGQNRVCIVVLIYLMKKYKWTAGKALEFLHSKKQDVEIPKYFLNQLTLFEQRMIKKGEELNSIPWNEDKPKDIEEKLMVNTYLNGLHNEAFERDSQVLRNKRHINWADSNPYKKEALASMNPMKDLFNQKDIKPITAHKKLHPMKSCIKKHIISGGDKEDMMLSNTSPLLGQDMATTQGSLASKYTTSNNAMINPFIPNKTTIADNKAQMISLAEINNNLSNTTGQLLAPNEYLINYSKLYEEKKTTEARSNNFSKNAPNSNQGQSQMQMQNVLLKNNSIRKEDIFQSNSVSDSKLTLTPTLMPMPLQMSMTTPMQMQTVLEKNNSILQSSSSITDTMKQQQKTVMSNNNPTTYSTKDQNDRVIIMNKFEHIVNNNINNIYIQGNINEMNPSHNLTQNIEGNNSQANNPLFVNNFISTLKLSNSEKNLNDNNSMIKQKEAFGQNVNLISELSNNNGRGNYMGNNNSNSNKIPKPEMQQQQQHMLMQQQQQRIQKNAFLNSSQQPLNNSLNDNNPNDKRYKINEYSNNNNGSINNYTPLNQYNNNSNKVKGNNNNMINQQQHQQQQQQQQQLLLRQQQIQMQIQEQQNRQQAQMQQQQDSLSSFNAINFQQSKPLNNYNPTLNKKNSYSTGALFNRQIPKGPVKINNNPTTNELYNRKPSTPNQISSITYINKDKENMSLNNYGIIHRSHSKTKDSPMAITMQINRPLTASHKDHSDYQFNQTNKVVNTKQPSMSSTSMNNQNVMKRLPSPQIQSNNMLNRTGQKPTQEKYRPPTPVMKSPNILVGSIKRSSGTRK